jgi:hypothetical protein
VNAYAAVIGNCREDGISTFVVVPQFIGRYDNYKWGRLAKGENVVLDENVGCGMEPYTNPRERGALLAAHARPAKPTTGSTWITIVDHAFSREA